MLTDATGAVLAAAADDPGLVLRSPGASTTVTADGILLDTPIVWRDSA